MAILRSIFPTKPDTHLLESLKRSDERRAERKLAQYIRNQKSLLYGNLKQKQRSAGRAGPIDPMALSLSGRKQKT